MATRSDSEETGSDAYTPHKCDPCNFMGSDKGATAYCGKCNAFLCKSCEQPHRGLAATRDHVLVTGNLLSSTFQPSPSLPITYCSDHRNNLLNGFCEIHKSLICDVCSATVHRKCSKTSLQDKTSKMKENQLDKMVKRLQEIKQKIKSLRSSRVKDKQLLIDQAKKSVRDVQELRRKINVKMDELENKAYKAIEDARKTTESDLKDHITYCDNILKAVDNNIKNMHDCQASLNKQIMFIGLTKSSGQVEEMEKITKDISSEKINCLLSFKPNEVIKEILQVTDLGQLITTFQSTVVSSDDNILDMKVSSKQDVNIDTDWITGSTFLSSGDLVLCDYHNNKLHLYSPTFTSKENVDLPSQPWDVCTVADTEVVVTLPGQQKIQFVSVQPRLRLEQSLRVDRKCWGIDCHGGMMYVTCHNDPGNGEVLVMTMDGQIQRRLGVDQGSYMFTCPDYVRVSRTSDRVYVSDWSTYTVTCLTQHGDVVYKYKHKDLSNPRDIHVDSQDNILVSGWLSHNIHRVDKHGTHHSILVSENDRVVGPFCLSYRDNDGALVVGTESKPGCKVFWLKK